MAIRPINDKIIAPYMSAPQGSFGYLGTLMFDEVEGKIQCHECGEWFISLGYHLTKIHKINAREYKEKYELNYSTGLCSPALSEKMSLRKEFAQKLLFDKMTPDEIHAQAVSRGKKGIEALKKAVKENRSRNRFSVEMMNRYGSCERQVEERFIKILEEMGHTPSWDELYARDPALLSILHRRFQGYTNALIYFGLSSKKRVAPGTYGKKNIEVALAKFVRQHKRLPNNKDTKIGYLPDHDTVARYFEGWMEAKKWAFKILKKEFPEEAKMYDENLKRIRLPDLFATQKPTRVRRTNASYLTEPLEY